jgi:hypothetical protein
MIARWGRLVSFGKKKEQLVRELHDVEKLQKWLVSAFHCTKSEQVRLQSRFSRFLFAPKNSIF